MTQDSVTNINDAATGPWVETASGERPDHNAYCIARDPIADGLYLLQYKSDGDRWLRLWFGDLPVVEPPKHWAQIFEYRTKTTHAVF